MLTTLSVLDALIAKDRTLSEAVEGFVRYPQVLVNVRVKQKVPFQSVPKIAQAAAGVEQELGSSGRLLLRYSVPKASPRVMIEGTDQTEIERLANDLAKVIEIELG